MGPSGPSGQTPPARPLPGCAWAGHCCSHTAFRAGMLYRITGGTSRTHTANGAFSTRINKARSFTITPLTPLCLPQPPTGPFQAGASLLEVIVKVLLSICYLEVSRSPPHSFKNAFTSSYTPTSLECGYPGHRTVQAMPRALWRSPAGP